MKARISTEINTCEDRMWAALQKVSSLMRVASPVLKFRPKAGQALPETWEQGAEYGFRLRLFGVVPLSDHHIHIVTLDKENKVLVSNEHGSLVRTWNHVIRLKSMGGNTIRYTDEIEIQAGLLTFPVWLFAHFFYRHRQRQWKKLIEDS